MHVAILYTWQFTMKDTWDCDVLHANVMDMSVYGHVYMYIHVHVQRRIQEFVKGGGAEFRITGEEGARQGHSAPC